MTQAGALSAVLTGFALSSSAPFGKKLSTWSDHRLRAAESFAAGTSLAYVIIDLMIELTGDGLMHVHATLPIGSSDERSLFVVVLLGATWWYLVGAIAAKRGRPEPRYWAYVVPQAIYCLFVGGALTLEADYGMWPLVLFALPILLHLTVIESHMVHDFERQHGGLPRVWLALMPGIGALGWALLGFSHAILFMVLALVAGSTVVQIIQTELPSPASVRVGPFLIGVALYLAMIVGRWSGGG
jgi:hypothetical protein